MISVYINRYVRQLNNNSRLSAYKALVKQDQKQPSTKQFRVKAVQNENSPRIYYDKVFESVLKWLRSQNEQNAFTLVLTTDSFATSSLQAKYNTEGFTNLHFTTAKTDQNATLMTLNKQTAMKVNQFVRKHQEEAKRKHDALVHKQKIAEAKKRRKIAHKKHLREIEHRRQVDIAKLVQKLHNSEEKMTQYFAEHHSTVINLNNLIHHRPISTTTQKQLDSIKLASSAPKVSPQQQTDLARKIAVVDKRAKSLNNVSMHQAQVAKSQSINATNLQRRQAMLAQTQKSAPTNQQQPVNPAMAQPNPNRANVGGSQTGNASTHKLQCLLSTIDGLLDQPKHSHINSNDIQQWVSRNDQTYIPFIMEYLTNHNYIAETRTRGTYKVLVGRYHGFF